MDFLDELENMAINAAIPKDASDEPSAETIKRWQDLFSYSYADAAELIKQHRADFTRKRISEFLWNLVKAQVEPEGHDRESYEHLLEIGGSAKKPSSITTQVALSLSQARAIYLIKLEGALDTAKKVQVASALLNIPKVFQGTGDDGDALFCQVDGATKLMIDNWISKQNSSYKAVFVRIKNAYKEFSDHSIYPTLGQDATLPQNRPHENAAVFLPSQDQYPVWYFFYGTLANIPKLTSVLSLKEGSAAPILHSASITGGKILTWGAGKYNALVNDPLGRVVGSAYQVMSKDHEDFLRLYETDAYEVVRCMISMENGEVVPGCTFRFFGQTD